jgi:hypothetical protein
MKKSKPDGKTQRFFRMWPRALFHMKEGKKLLGYTLNEPGVYVLYRDDTPYYIGKTSKPLITNMTVEDRRASLDATDPPTRQPDLLTHSPDCGGMPRAMELFLSVHD